MQKLYKSTPELKNIIKRLIHSFGFTLLIKKPIFFFYGALGCNSSLVNFNNILYYFI